MKPSQNPRCYLVAGSRKWNRRIFEEEIACLSGTFRFVENSTQLDATLRTGFAPRYIFFLHWSDKVIDEILESYECVCFHMADVPYGRGGSPLQNLIVRGHGNTKLTALRMTAAFDAGPVYLKQELSLAGNAEEIYIRAGRLSAAMIRTIISTEPVALEQTGTPVVFKRRNPGESQIDALETLDALYDFIRMLDAEGYPQAYIDYHGFRFSFRRAGLYNGRIEADVTIRPLRDVESGLAREAVTESVS